ncbi:MAG: hypothetical protein JOZ71_00115, partial [Ktedonobacteraceae bacterium]|nr:hypothetical protein [Ktedonobacteraceae bacterium]
MSERKDSSFTNEDGQERYSINSTPDTQHAHKTLDEDDFLVPGRIEECEGSIP